MDYCIGGKTDISGSSVAERGLYFGSLYRTVFTVVVIISCMRVVTLDKED